nr:DUF58 domain-containing protein [Marinibactrum halimedae]
MVLRWPQGSETLVSLEPGEQARFAVYVKAHERGWFYPGRITVKSVYPLGIFRCWTHLDLGVQILTYPKPINAGPIPPAVGNNDEGKLHSLHGGEDFAGLKTYQLGDSLRHVAWKQYARGQGLHTKNFSAFLDSRHWLDWDLLAGLDTEARLSRLTYWALELEKTASDYGLRLPGVEIIPSRGKHHQDAVLKALALFGKSDEPASLTVKGEKR